MELRKDAPAAVLNPTASGPSPYHFSASQRSRGIAETVVRLSSKKDQKLSGSLHSPGNRHPIPTIAIGSAASVAPTCSRALRAINASLTAEILFVFLSDVLICVPQEGQQGLRHHLGLRLLICLSLVHLAKGRLWVPGPREACACQVGLQTKSR